MRVVCPACAAAYEVPEAVIQARRTLRCTGCGERFPARGAAPTEPVSSRAPSAPPAVPPAQRPVSATPDPDAAMRAGQAARLPISAEPPPRVSRARTAAVVAGWALSLVVLAAGAGAALAWRQPIMRAWPPSTRAYAALGYSH